MNWKRITGLFRRAQPRPTRPRGTGQGQWETDSIHTASGSRKYKLWVPATYDPRCASPLVMMLHGCRQKPQDLAEISGMNAIADRNNFLVVYPEQPLRANLLRCWNWFDPKHQARGAGEPALLAAVIEKVSSHKRIDRARVYIAGISAGGAMAAVVGATYPDLIAAVGAVAGLEYKAASSLTEGLAAMKHGGPDPEQMGLLAYQTMTPGLSGRPKRMPVIVFQGDEDRYVNRINADQVISQWATTNQCLHGDSGRSGIFTDVQVTQGKVPGGRSFEKHAYHDRHGHLIMEKWMVAGMDHAWPGSPVAADYADPEGPNASEEMWRFFEETTRESSDQPASRKNLFDRLAGLFR